MSKHLIYVNLKNRREILEKLRNIMDELVTQSMIELEEIQKDEDLIYTKSNVNVYKNDNIWHLF